MEKPTSLFYLLKTFLEAEDENESFEIIFKQFEPLLIKYALMLNDINYKYVLAEALYNALKMIPLHKEHFIQNKYIISYIKNSVRNASGKIWRDNNKYNHSSLDSEVYANTLESTTDDFSLIWYNEMLERIKVLLSDEEYNIFMLIYSGYSESEVSRFFGVTRQAVCKRLKRIRSKLINKLNMGY